MPEQRAWARRTLHSLVFYAKKTWQDQVFLTLYALNIINVCMRQCPPGAAVSAAAAAAMAAAAGPAAWDVVPDLRSGCCALTGMRPAATADRPACLAVRTGLPCRQGRYFYLRWAENKTGLPCQGQTCCGHALIRRAVTMSGGLIRGPGTWRKWTLRC